MVAKKRSLFTYFLFLKDPVDGSIPVADKK
jgi:hypothetical protein